MAKRRFEEIKKGRIKDTFGINPNIDLQWNREVFNPFNLPSALHEWNYQNATDVGTTVTAIDTGSIGGFDMTNPTAVEKPTLTSNGFGFSGSQGLKYNTSAFRSSDASGVVHTLVYFDANNMQTFATADSASELSDRYRFIVVSENSRFQICKSGSIANQITTATYSGWKLVSIVNNGIDNFHYIDGVEILSFSVDNVGGNWFNQISANDNISIGVTYRLTPIYGTGNVKYVAYCGYVSKASAEADMNLILNSGL
jgi:hypothetical protein